MKNIIPFLVALSVLFTGCIEIVEEISINEDQSGTMMYKIETDEIGGILNVLSELAGGSFENEMKREIERYTGKLRGKSGISNIAYNFRDSSGDYYVSFDFGSDKHLNAALYDIFGIKKTILTPKFLTIKKSKFKKSNYAPWVERYLESEDIELPESTFSNFVTLKSVTHTSKKIKKASGQSVKLPQDRKTVTQHFDIQEIIDNKIDVGLKLKY